MSKITDILEYNKENYENIVSLSPWINVYALKNHYIFNQPKVASSYMDNYGESSLLMNVSFDRLTFEILEIGESGSAEEELSTIRYEKKGQISREQKYKDFKNDWKNLIQNKPTKRKFVFLVRNPIQKFIAGITQDFVIINQDEQLQGQIVEIKKDSNSKYYTEWSFKNGLHQEQYEERIQSRLKLYYEHPDCMIPVSEADVEDFGAGILHRGGYMGGGHMKDYTFFYYGLFEKLNGCSPKSPLSLIDINIQSLHNTLWDWGYRQKRQGLGLKRNDTRQHVKPKLLNIMVRYLISKKSWGGITNEAMKTNTQAWIQLIKRQYSYMDFDGSNEDINSIEDYFNDNYIIGKHKTWEDLINIESHQSWCSKESVVKLEETIRTYNKANPEFISQRDSSKDYDAYNKPDFSRVR